VVGEEERRRAERWFRAIVAARDAGHRLDADSVEDVLVGAGFSRATAALLVERGGGDAVRRDTGPGSALRILAREGIDLTRLDRELRNRRDAGLFVGVADRDFDRWRAAHWRRLAAVLTAGWSPDVAKQRARGIAVPDALRWELDPLGTDLLAGVAELLQEAGLSADVAALATVGDQELARLAECSIDELDTRVRLLFDED
jgi:hypothetical protein